ncbi:MAG: diversity-generating retroelement protein Avd, partial [Proteobacteria bacterium]|nr:diversity-generating retroelement protein Avd [Pseudomonadota bacterium]MCP4751607.1 diversity-generating retroelement protein Avd [Pseudomonadota bacterium]
FSQRMENLALDIVEDLIQARYSRKKTDLLKGINLNLEKLRILIRICHEMRYLSGSQYEYASRQINEAGSMVGGWIKHQRQAKKE